MAAENKPLKILRSIKKFITPLSPPVYAFESSIRSTPFRILVSVLLSARTQDPVTEKAAARLFTAAATPETMARLSHEQVSRLIYPVGFYRTKARNILAICAILHQGGKFPSSLDEMLALPGIGRKSANLVLALAFNVPAIAVDTHVFRIAKRLGWAKGRTGSTRCW
jgi:endonuclease-3